MVNKILSVMALLLVGCAHVAYKDGMEYRQLATLRAIRSNGLSITFVSVDGEKVSYFKDYVKMGPGTHSVQADFLVISEKLTQQKVMPVTLDFVVESGKHYSLYGSFDVFGFSAFVMDEQSLKIVAEAKHYKKRQRKF